jgi:hypothetical protein
MQWATRMGAVTAEALACRGGTSVASARSRLVAAARDGLLVRRRPLNGHPALYTITSAGIAASGLRGLGPCRVSPSNALHLIACASAAAALERGYPDHRLLGERELRHEETQRGAPMASARLGMGAHGIVFHRPDLVLVPAGPDRALPVAIEVELTIKAPRRLAEICRAWARSRDVEGVVHLAAPAVRAALERAVEKAHARDRIVIAPIDALASSFIAPGITTARTIPADA